MGKLCWARLLFPFSSPEEGAAGRESKAAALADTAAASGSGSSAWLHTEVPTMRLLELMQPLLFVFVLMAYSLALYQHTDPCLQERR